MQSPALGSFARKHCFFYSVVRSAHDHVGAFGKGRHFGKRGAANQKCPVVIRGNHYRRKKLLVSAPVPSVSDIQQDAISAFGLDDLAFNPVGLGIFNFADGGNLQCARFSFGQYPVMQCV